MARKREQFQWTFIKCQGSGYAPYKYDPQARQPTRTPKGRIKHAKGQCFMCNKMITVNVDGRLRKHLRKVPL